MKHSVQVTIERIGNKIIVKNNCGTTWEYTRKEVNSKDHSLNASIADIASAMLTGTITSQLEYLASTELKFTLTIDNK